MHNLHGICGLIFVGLGALALAPAPAAAAGVTSLREQGATAKGATDTRSLDQPSRDSAYVCGRQVMGEALDRPWLAPDGTIHFAKKPVVEGSVEWPSRTSVGADNERRTIESNGLPGHMTGVYPVQRGSDAYRFDRNPNALSEQAIRYVLPVEPEVAAKPTCLPMGTIGVALSGAVFFNPLDAPGRDAVANEIFDACEGHPERRGRYHYHHGSPCFDAGDAGVHSPLVGYALDGFGIHGPRGAGGEIVTNAVLDECHGHEGAVPLPDGGTATGYHYHLNEEFPYTLGCFRGKVDQTFLTRQRPPGGGERRGPPPRGGPPPRR